MSYVHSNFTLGNLNLPLTQVIFVSCRPFWEAYNSAKLYPWQPEPRFKSNQKYCSEVLNTEFSVNYVPYAGVVDLGGGGGGGGVGWGS